MIANGASLQLPTAASRPKPGRSPAPSPLRSKEGRANIVSASVEPGAEDLPEPCKRQGFRPAAMAIVSSSQFAEQQNGPRQDPGFKNDEPSTPDDPLPSVKALISASSINGALHARRTDARGVWVASETLVRIEFISLSMI